MTFTAWETAHGDAAPAFLQCSDTVALSPADDSVDTNDIIIEGAGTISSFGESPHRVLKRVKFVPLVMAEHAAPGSPAITLINSNALNLLGKKNRAISGVSYGMYLSDGQNSWSEVYFVQQGSALINELEERIAALEKKLQPDA
jgi:hypothetical protein